jgi:CubicO group peptidase (beta-lactamase class C family)
MTHHIQQAWQYARHSMLLFVLLAIIFLPACQKEQQQVDIAQKETVLDIIQSEKETQGLHSVAFCVVKNDQVLWSDAMGNADEKNNIAATPQTRYLIASISKAVTAIAMMQLYEKGLFNLDDDINLYLPFKVVNPNHPDVPITFKMLLNHTASISDKPYASYNFYCWNHDCPTALGDFMHDYFEPGAPKYSTKNFYTYKPGEQANYSNMGFALIGYLVEVIAKKPFDTYCKENIFKPLDMDKTEWRLANIPLNELAIPYSPTFTSNTPHFTFPDYPNGGLRTTVLDLSKILRMVAMKGVLNNQQILKSETITLMQQETSTIKRGSITFHPGLGMYYRAVGGMNLYGHSGGEQGTTTDMLLDINTGIGAIVFTNTGTANLDIIISSLIQYAGKQ